MDVVRDGDPILGANRADRWLVVHAYQARRIAENKEYILDSNAPSQALRTNHVKLRHGPLSSMRPSDRPSSGYGALPLPPLSVAGDEVRGGRG